MASHEKIRVATGNVITPTTIVGTLVTEWCDVMTARRLSLDSPAVTSRSAPQAARGAGP